MNLRAPSYPLITVDPNFSVWSPADRLTDVDTEHWTASPMKICAVATVDGVEYRIIGNPAGNTVPPMTQVKVDLSAFTTTYVFEEAGVRLTLRFTSPILPDDLYLLSRPVSYLSVSCNSLDGVEHQVGVKISVSEEICMNLRGDDTVDCEILSLTPALASVKMGTTHQKMLERYGDDLRAEWGYFYLSVDGGRVGVTTADYTVGEGDCAKTAAETFVFAEAELGATPTLFSFAYDDIKSIEYFHEQLTSFWNRNGARITDEIVAAHADYADIYARCQAFGDKMFTDAVRAGGEKYAELLELSLRQVLAAHKLAVDTNGDLLYISKECFSNGCAATVDVSYPSIPLFLIYNPELIKGMLRPVYRYAECDEWQYDFAPHDAGRYPIVNGQMYGLTIDRQMPVEECGNMLIMEAALAVATGDASFANEHFELLEQWSRYLLENGRDPGNQLCTDDFAGHLAHNCNLTLKAIVGIACLGILYGMNGRDADRERCMTTARELADDWCVRASNGDGSYRLAFDKPGSFSMKYNVVWDKLFGLELFSPAVIASEVASYLGRMHPYGLPLDNRQPYTKSDWLVWTATLAADRRDFERFIAPMWDAFHYSTSRMPMIDWYLTLTARHIPYNGRDGVRKSFRNRTVQGGLFIKLLEYYRIMDLKP